MTDATFSTADIEKLIPHRLPMRLVEDIVRVDEISIETVAVVRETWPTANGGHVRTLVLVELIAQSAATLQGWKERHEKQMGIGGLLVGIHNAKASRPVVPVGTELCCSVRISHGATNYLAFEGEVKDASGVLWVSGSIQAFRPDLAVQPGERT
jgi:predicted hotdog family 3-hydroxylacyl-ACP dehydratase